MSSLPSIFYDLAIILVTAGCTTVIFKWLKQPLVLGYIVAGFFIGPYFPWFPAITDDSNIRVWSDIGIVFLMFALGLEFSIKKLKKVGSTGAITALTELIIMFLIGSSVGRLLGFESLECVFLGCMLSISSTTIIIKSFDDLKMKQQKFTSTVTAVLVVEDLVAVLLLVFLSTLSVSKHFDGAELGRSMLKLVFFLIVWFTFGIFLLPSLLKRMRRYMTEETLCVVAVGLCFGMVVLANYAGFSTALGAFVMGAILAETIEADAIHRIITPVKNLFGAVFFVSVGMLVDPHILVKYVVPIVVIAATVVVFKSSAATLGVLLSGKKLKTAVQSGFCFCQIGEFSFIIAELGLSFGVINADLYPVIVSVSIITTFVTPYMVKAALPFYEKFYPMVPRRVKEGLERYSISAKSSTDEASIRRFLKKQLSSIMLYGVITMALCMLSFGVLKPVLNGLFVAPDGTPSIWGNLIGMGATLLVLSPFLWAMVVHNNSKKHIKMLLQEYAHSQAIVLPVLLFRYVTAMLFVGLVVGRYIHLALGFILVIALLVVVTVVFSSKTVAYYQRIENRFIDNFNQRQAQHSFKIPESLEQNFQMERIPVTQYSPFVGKRLYETGFREQYGVNVVSIERGEHIYDLPSKDMVIMPLDRLTVIGGEDEIMRFRSEVDVEPNMFIHDHSDNELNIYRLEVKNNSNLLGLQIRTSNFQVLYHALIIAIERGEEYMLNPKPDTSFFVGDVVWFVSPQEITLDNFMGNKLDESEFQ